MTCNISIHVLTYIKLMNYAYYTYVRFIIKYVYIITPFIYSQSSSLIVTSTEVLTTPA